MGNVRIDYRFLQNQKSTKGRYGQNQTPIDNGWRRREKRKKNIDEGRYDTVLDNEIEPTGTIPEKPDTVSGYDQNGTVPERPDTVSEYDTTGTDPDNPDTASEMIYMANQEDRRREDKKSENRNQPDTASEYGNQKRYTETPRRTKKLNP